MTSLKSLSMANLLGLSFGFAVLVFLVARGLTGFVVASMPRTLVHTTVANTRANFDLSIQVRERIQSEEFHMRRVAVLVDVKAISDEVELAIEDDKMIRLALENFALQDLSTDDKKSVAELKKLQLEAEPYRDEVVNLMKAMQPDQAEVDPRVSASGST